METALLPPPAEETTLARKMGLNSHEQLGIRESSSFRLRALRSSFFSFGLEQPCLLWSREQKESSQNNSSRHGRGCAWPPPVCLAPFRLSSVPSYRAPWQEWVGFSLLRAAMLKSELMRRKQTLELSGFWGPPRGALCSAMRWYRAQRVVQKPVIAPRGRLGDHRDSSPSFLRLRGRGLRG